MSQLYQSKQVYIITNNINRKQYVGQSIHAERRFIEHKTYHQYKSLIQQAIKKYGSENFSMEILYEGPDYNEKEKYYINYYNTKAPNGYNIEDGGEDPPVMQGENHPLSKLSLQEVQEIQQRLISGEKTDEIIKDFPCITQGQLNRINIGQAWHDNSLTYPLRYEKGVSPQEVEAIIEDLKKCDLTLEEIGEKYGYCKGAIVNINQGTTQLARKKSSNFPIRKKNDYIKHHNKKNNN